MAHDFTEVINELKSIAKPENIKGMSRFGMKGGGRLTEEVKK